MLSALRSEADSFTELANGSQDADMQTRRETEKGDEATFQKFYLIVQLVCFVTMLIFSCHSND